MNKTRLKRMFALFLCMMLIAATALFAQGCKKGEPETPKTPEKGDTAETIVKAPEDGSDKETDKSSVLGEGKTQFTFKVVDGEGNETVFTVNTDEKIVGDALLEVNLIEGDEGPYGLYVKKVNGIEADYEKDKTYWAFYVNGEYAMNGVDTTEIENGAEYSFKIER